MPGREYRVKNPYFPERELVFSWNSLTEPTEDDIRQIAREQASKKSPGVVRQTWDFLNEPLTTAPLDWANKFSTWMTEPKSTDTPGYAQLKGFIGGAAEGLGNVASSFTSPLGIVTTGALGLGRVGLGGLNTAIQRTAGTGLLGAGIQDVTQGNLAGIPEIAGGLLGIKTPPAIRKPGFAPITDERRLLPAARTAGELPPVTVPTRFIASELGAVEDLSPGLSVTLPKPKSTQPKAGPIKTYTQPPVEIVTPKEFVSKFEYWDGSRKAAEFEAALVARNFEDLRPLGFQGITEIQKGSTANPRFRAVRVYFDDKFAQLQKSGMRVNYIRDYMPQLWDNTWQEIAAGMKGRLESQPGFSLTRVLDDYEAGIKAGLKPRFDNIPDLIAWYEQRANKVLADREFFQYLRKADLIRPNFGKNKAPHDWVALNADTFPIIAGKGRAGEAWFAPTRLSLPDGTEVNPAKIINNYLGEGSDILEKIARAPTFMKNMALTGGIPYSGVNWHSMFNIGLGRGSALALEGAMRGDVKSLAIPLRIAAKSVDPRGIISKVTGTDLPTYAKTDLADLMKEAPRAVRSGLVLGAEGWRTPGTKPQGFIQKFEGAFGDVTFQQIIPAEKLRAWLSLSEHFASKGLAKGAAEKAAATYVNNMFGGINKSLRSKDLQNVLRSTVLAPDWLETKFQIGKEAVRALTDPSNPVGQAYLRLVAGMAIIKFGTDYISRGGEMPPTPSRSGQIPIGVDERGRAREFDPTGAAYETIDLPYKLATDNPLEAAARFARFNSSIPAQKLITFAKNEDWRRRPIYGKDKYGREVKNQWANVAAEIADMITPQQVQAIIEYGSGRATAEEALATGLEIPFRYYNPPRVEPPLKRQSWRKF